MHAFPSHPKHPLLFGLLVLCLALAFLAAAAPDLGTLDFSVGGEAPAPESRAVEPAAPVEPTWVTDPLSPPLERLTR
jgi:hypothetical protein